MICPHCRKTISWNITPAALVRGLELRKEGYSLRDIEYRLKEEGMHASFGSLSRHFRKFDEQEKLTAEGGT